MSASPSYSFSEPRRDLRIEYGLGTSRDVALDDPLLCRGFHPLEDGVRCWTAGRAHLPAALWQDAPAGFVLHVDLAGPAALGGPVPKRRSLRPRSVLADGALDASAIELQRSDTLIPPSVGWVPTGPGLLADIDQAGYYDAR